MEACNNVGVTFVYTAGEDYDAVPLSPQTTVMFGPGSTRECFNVMIRDDAIVENLECFRIDANSLSSSIGIELGEDSTLVCIDDVDSECGLIENGLLVILYSLMFSLNISCLLSSLSTHP